MNTEYTRQQRVSHQSHGWTVVDVFVTVAVVAVIIGIFILFPKRTHVKAAAARCSSSLMEIGAGFAEFAADHSGHSPWQTSETDGGSSSYVSTPASVYRHYLAMSNTISLWGLVCPRDKRMAPTSWKTLTDENLSYFLDLTTSWSDRRVVIAGDRYLTTNSSILRGLISVTPNSGLKWAKQFHSSSGNLLLTDGTVKAAKSNVLDQFSIKLTSTNLMANLFPVGSPPIRHLAVP